MNATTHTHDNDPVAHMMSLKAAEHLRYQDAKYDNGA